MEAGVPGQPLGAQAGICGDPGSPEYWNDLGAIAFVRGYASLAEDHFRKAIHTDSRYVPAYDNLVHLLMAQNRLVEAHGLRETYAELFPERAKGFLCAGHREERACELSVLIPAFNEAGKFSAISGKSARVSQKPDEFSRSLWWMTAVRMTPTRSWNFFRKPYERSGYTSPEPTGAREVH